MQNSKFKINEENRCQKQRFFTLFCLLQRRRGTIAKRWWMRRTNYSRHTEITDNFELFNLKSNDYPLNCLFICIMLPSSVTALKFYCRFRYCAEPWHLKVNWPKVKRSHSGVSPPGKAHFIGNGFLRCLAFSSGEGFLASPWGEAVSRRLTDEV